MSLDRGRSSLSGPRVARVLDDLIELRGRPISVLTDNGPEFAGLALEHWAHDRQVHHRFITPGKPSLKLAVATPRGRRWWITLLQQFAHPTTDRNAVAALAARASPYQLIFAFNCMIPAEGWVGRPA